MNKKTNRRIFIGLFIFTITIPIYAQTEQANLAKYWKYRDRLRSKFIVVSENVMDYGVNIPASDIYYKSDSTKSYICWGDGNNNMSHYLSVLATELWLLKHNNKDYTTTLKELYFAMLALERLDVYSESNLRWKAFIGPWIENDYWEKQFVHLGDINGFMLRNDVTDNFWKKYGNHFDVNIFSSNFSASNTSFFMEENSQDVIEHTMEGLGLVSKLIGKESVVNINCNFSDIYVKPRLTKLGILTSKSDINLSPDSIDFSLWAKDFVKRFIHYMQSDEVYRKHFGGIIPFSTHWILMNPVTKKCVMEGSGSDSGVALISNGIIKAGEAITGEKLRIYPSKVSDNLYNLAFKYPWIFQLGREDNKTRSLAIHVRGNKTFAKLRKLRDHYNPHKTGHFPIYEHFPLMYLVSHNLNYSEIGLSNNDYNSEKTLYQGLLNSAPINGPASNCGIYDWTSTSRCLWPENLGKKSDQHIEYNGLDYMMLYNLYQIAFLNTEKR